MAGPGSDYLEVKRGDAIASDLWNRLVATNRARTIFQGENTRINMMPAGTIVHSNTQGYTWVHPWMASISNTGAVLQPGLVNLMEPSVATKEGDIKMSESPVLVFQDSLWDDAGNGWICVELQMDDKDGEIKEIHVVQAPNISTDETTVIELPQLFHGIGGLPDHRARYPLVKIRRVDVGTVDVAIEATYQIAMFHMNHKAKPAVTPDGIARHFFWPV